MNKILVTGGCGYIGSHTIVDLIDHGFDVISVDNLINASEKSLDGIYKITGKRVKNYQVDLTDDKALENIFAENTDIVGVVHFAALKAVGESVEKPLLYYRNNLIGLLNLLDNITLIHFLNIHLLFFLLKYYYFFLFPDFQHVYMQLILYYKTLEFYQ